MFSAGGVLCNEGSVCVTFSVGVRVKTSHIVHFQHLLRTCCSSNKSLEREVLR